MHPRPAQLLERVRQQAERRLLVEIRAVGIRPEPERGAVIRERPGDERQGERHELVEPDQHLHRRQPAQVGVTTEPISLPGVRDD